MFNKVILIFDGCCLTVFINVKNLKTNQYAFIGATNKLEIYIFECNQAPYTQIESGIIQTVQLESVNKIDSSLETLV